MGLLLSFSDFNRCQKYPLWPKMISAFERARLRVLQLSLSRKDVEQSTLRESIVSRAMPSLRVGDAMSKLRKHLIAPESVTGFHCLTDEYHPSV